MMQQNEIYDGKNEWMREKPQDKLHGGKGPKPPSRFGFNPVG
jgi:hypothetical protein